MASLADVTLGSGGSVINSNSASLSILTLSPSGGSTTFSGAIDGSQGQISLVMSGSGTQVLNGSLLGSGSLSVSAGTLVLGGVNPMVGITTLSGGALQVANPLALEGQTLDINTSDLGTLSISTTSLSLGGLMGSRNLAAPAIPLTIGGNGSSTTYSGNLSGATSLTKSGSGSLYLSGSNSYGSTIVAAGALEAAGTASLPHYLSSGSVSVAAGGSLVLPTGNGGSGWSNSQISGLLTSNSGGFAVNSTLGLDTASGDVAYPSNIPVGLNKLGANTLTLSGTAFGPVTVSNGAVALTAASVSTGGLSGGGSLLLGSAGLNGTILTVNSTGSPTTFSGVITEVQSPSSLVKMGPATLTLSSANSYSGGTTIGQGTLVTSNVSPWAADPCSCRTAACSP